MKGYKLDCCLSSKDTYVLSCSEDGHVYCWDLVEVSMHFVFRARPHQYLTVYSHEECIRFNDRITELVVKSTNMLMLHIYDGRIISLGT